MPNVRSEHLAVHCMKVHATKSISCFAVQEGQKPALTMYWEHAAAGHSGEQACAAAEPASRVDATVQHSVLIEREDHHTVRTLTPQTEAKRLSMRVPVLLCRIKEARGPLLLAPS